MRLCIERSLKSITHDGQYGEFVFCFDADENTFKGHFPGHPILPGVFQLEMVRFCCEQIAGTRLNITRINKASFTRPIFPEEDILVTSEINRDENIIHVKSTLTVSNQKAGKCILQLTEPPET